MAINDAWNALSRKTNSTDIAPKSENGVTAIASDAFPVVKLQESQLAAYRQIPLTGLAALGTAFAQLPESARTIVESKTKTIATNQTVFVGINPKGISGFLRENEFGTTGNIMQVNPQGKQVIAGRMRFKPIDGLPVNETTTTVMPVDPMLMVVAVALISIEKKLESIQESVEEVIQYLKLEKQSSQRGNLNMLSEIMDDYKLNCQNEQFCLSRLQAVLAIKKDAHKDILFYQEQISAELQKQKGLHGAKSTQNLIDAVTYQFAEYQLACHLYAFSSFLDIMLQGNFDSASIESVTDKMIAMAKRYKALYADCHAQIAKYQRSSIEAQLVGGIGVAAKGLGKVIASVPVIRDGPVDEALISAGNSIGEFNRDTVQRKLQAFEMFEDNRMNHFIENLQSVNLLHNTKNAMITDGIHLYLLQPT
ncbi:MAG: hypothetical protein ACI3W7_03040 [Oscillospiraceae bacterium]